MKALIVDDEQDIAEAISLLMQRSGLQTVICNDGDSGLAEALTGGFSIIVLDILLPGTNGFSICRTLREAGVTTPILCVSAKSGEFDEVEALELGADDYLRKPFSMEVLNARISALLRRPHSVTDTRSFAGITYDVDTREVRVDGNAVHLTPREGEVLIELIRAGDRPVSKVELLKSVWGMEFDGNPNVVEVYIRYLRQKLGAKRVDTIPRTGYRLNSSKDQ